MCSFKNLYKPCGFVLSSFLTSMMHERILIPNLNIMKTSSNNCGLSCYSQCHIIVVYGGRVNTVAVLITSAII